MNDEQKTEGKIDADSFGIIAFRIPMRIILILLFLEAVASCSPGCDSDTHNYRGSTTMESNHNARLHADDAHYREIMAEARLEMDALYRKYYTTQQHYVRLKDRVILAVPTIYRPFWLLRDDLRRSPIPIEQVPVMASFGFQMFFPEFGGYTFENYSNNFHPDRVDITEIEPVSPEEFQGNPGMYGDAQTLFDRDIEWGTVDSAHLEHKYDEYGLTCYRSKTSDYERYDCLGKRYNGELAFVTVDEFPQPGGWPPNPRVWVNYFTPALGGIHINFDLSRRHLAQWREADEAMWKKLQAWQYKP